MVASVKGRLEWERTGDKKGHRDYRLVLLVRTTDPADGPLTVAFASGLPAIGSPWAYGNDFDFWAKCWPNHIIRPVIQGEPNKLWTVELTFSTRPLERCQDQQIDDPLLEPQSISGSFVTYTKPLEKDRNGKPILSSSLEKIPGLERDAHRPTVIIEQNVAPLGLATFSPMIHTVNDAPLWGLAKRKIKLSNVAWQRHLFGLCNFYYTRRLEFDINFDGFDLVDVPDMGFKELDTDIENYDLNNPAHYKVIKDGNDENTPVRMPLKDGVVNPDPVGDPQYLDPIEAYGESNFLTLGIPTLL